MRRWALALPGWSGKAATVALVAVMVGLMVFSGWVAIETRATAVRAQQALLLNDAYDAASVALADQRVAQVEYRTSPSSDLRLEFDKAGQKLSEGLDEAEALGDAGDRAAVAQIRLRRARYDQASKTFFDSIDSGQIAAQNSSRLEIGLVFPETETLIATKAAEQERESRAALEAQTTLAGGALTITPWVFGCGLLLVAFMTLVLDANRRARDSKSSFLARMSHELRTPLNSVLGFSDLLITLHGADLSQKQRRYVDNIRSSGLHLLELINDVLDFSKIEAGKMAVTLASISVDDAIQAALEEVSPQIDAKGLDLLPLTGTRGLTCTADGMRLRQVLLNGLSNAIKFTDRGGSLTIFTRLHRSAVEIDVVDNGCGIPDAQLSRMFREFEQMDDDRSRSSQGTGIGLPLSRALLEMMGGSLTLASQVGQGTTFHVRLPIGIAPAPHEIAA